MSDVPSEGAPPVLYDSRSRWPCAWASDPRLRAVAGDAIVIGLARRRSQQPGTIRLPFARLVAGDARDLTEAASSVAREFRGQLSWATSVTGGVVTRRQGRLVARTTVDSSFPRWAAAHLGSTAVPSACSEAELSGRLFLLDISAGANRAT